MLRGGRGLDHETPVAVEDWLDGKEPNNPGQNVSRFPHGVPHSNRHRMDGIVLRWVAGDV